MNIERLNELSTDALYVLAEKMKLDLPPELERVFVLEALSDAFDEDKLDRNDISDSAVHIENNKFSGTELDDFDVSIDAAPCIVRRYNETAVHVIVRDPEWAYVFWDIRDEEFEHLKAISGFSSFFLRVTKICPNEKDNFSFDVAVSDNDDHWYLHVPDANSQYRVDLYARFGVKHKLLTRSDVFHTPCSKLMHFEECSSSTKKLAELSGIYDCNILPLPELDF